MISPPPSKTFSVLVVDDEPSLRKMVRASLGASGFAVEEAGSGQDAVAAIRQKPYEIVLLDVKMPDIGGVEVCRQIRALSPRMGIVMVTVCDSEEDKVLALEAGADDYVTKPFQFRELVARLGALLRRSHAAANSASGALQIGELKLEPERHLLRKGQEQIRLSPKEFDLLAHLMKNPGAPMTHGKLLRAVWGSEDGSEREFLGSYIRMLRKKIEDDPARPEYILTEDGVGYRFRNRSDGGLPAGQRGAS